MCENEAVSTGGVSTGFTNVNKNTWAMSRHAKSQVFH